MGASLKAPLLPWRSHCRCSHHAVLCCAVLPPRSLLLLPLLHAPLLLLCANRKSCLLCWRAPVLLAEGVHTAEQVKRAESGMVKSRHGEKQ